MIKIRTGKFSKSFGDDHPTAIKIREGHDYTIENGEVKVGKMYTEPKNKWQFKKEVEKIDTTNPAKAVLELKHIFIKMLGQWPE